MLKYSRQIKFERKDVPANAISLLIMTYKDRITLFCYIFLFLYKQNVDLSIRKRNKGGEGYSNYTINKKYNEIVLVSLVLLKRIENLQLEKKITNEDLIFIRGCAINEHFHLDESNIRIIKKTQSNIMKVPSDFSDAIKHSRTVIDKDGYDIHKIVNAKKNDFSSYTNIITFPYYKSCIDLLMEECDNKLLLDETIIEKIKKSSSNFLRNIKIDRDILKYSREKKDYQNSNDSFLAVFESNEINNSYYLTRNRFCEHYPEEIESKFFETIGKRTQKNKK